MLVVINLTTSHGLKDRLQKGYLQWKTEKNVFFVEAFFVLENDLQPAATTRKMEDTKTSIRVASITSFGGHA